MCCLTLLDETMANGSFARRRRSLSCPGRAQRDPGPRGHTTDRRDCASRAFRTGSTQVGFTRLASLNCRSRASPRSVSRSARARALAALARDTCALRTLEALALVSRASAARPGSPGAARRLATRNILRFAALCAGSRLSLRSRKCARSARPGQEIGAHAQGPRARCTRPGYESGVTPPRAAADRANGRSRPACRPSATKSAVIFEELINSSASLAS